MKGILIKLLSVIITAALSISLSAQTSLSTDHDAVQIPDSCKPVVPADTIFSPKLHFDQGTFYEPDEMPVFPGGDEAILLFIKKNANYPSSAVEDSVSGRVILVFAVGTGGCPTNFRILKGIREDLNNESLRVAALLPKFRPGRTVRESPKGLYLTTVEVWYSLPFNYRFNNDPKPGKYDILPASGQ